MNRFCILLWILFLSLINNGLAFGVNFGRIAFRKCSSMTRLPSAIETYELSLPINQQGDQVLIEVDDSNTDSNDPEVINCEKLYPALSIAAGMLPPLKMDRALQHTDYANRITNLFLYRKRAHVAVILHPAIVRSTYLLEKYESKLIPRIILGGLANVAEIDYLNTLPLHDPRRRLLATIEEPGPEKRAELETNLQAIEDERDPRNNNVSVRSVYEDIAYTCINNDYETLLEMMVDREHARKQKVGYLEYDTNATAAGRVADLEKIKKHVFGLSPAHNTSLTGPLQTRMYEYFAPNTPLVGKYRANREIDRLSATAAVQNMTEFINEVIYTVIKLSPALKEKYPNSEDRMPENFLRGWMNVVDIDLALSYQEGDPRRFFLDTIAEPGPARRAQLEEDVRLIDNELRLILGRQNDSASLMRDAFAILTQMSIMENYLYIQNYDVDMNYIRQQQDEYIVKKDRYEKDGTRLKCKF